VRNYTATEPNPVSDSTTSKSKASASSGRADRAQSGKSIPEDAIRIRAHQKWEAAGKPNGEDLRFWLEAQREILQSN